MRPVLLCVFLAASALAQSPAPPAFDVASVKINSQFRPEDRATWMRTIDTTPGTLTMRNVNLTMIVAWAYDTQWPQVVGPDWIESQRYDIIAKADGPAKDAQMRVMLQTLLAERFKLASHRETRELEVMALIEPKGGNKMKASESTGPPKNHQDPVLGMVVEGVTLEEVAGEFSREITIPIVNMTGLKGRFDFAMNPQKYVAALRSAVRADPHAQSEAELHVSLLQDVVAGELGLRMERRKAPVEVVVIDKAEKTPVEN